MKRDQDYYDSIEQNRRHPLPDDVFQEYLRADGLNLEKKTDEARSILLPILREFPGNPRVLNLIGNSYLADSEFSVAEEYYTKSLEIDPTLHFVYSNLCNLHLTMGQIEEAGEYARKAVKFGSKSASVWNSLGMYYAFKGQIETALDYFNAAYSMEDTRPDILYNIACALIELGRIEEGLEKLKPSLSSQITFYTAQKDESLKAVRETPEFKEIMTEAAKLHGED